MILVTGGTGLLGGHLLPKLLLLGEKIRVLVRENTDYRKILPVWEYCYPEVIGMIENIDWFRGDITDRSYIHEAMEGIDRIYHCAAVVSFDRFSKSEMLKTNVQGTRNIVDLALELNIKKLVYVSSIAAIGPGAEGELLTEKNSWTVHPNSMYALTKTLAEQEVWRGISEGLNAVIINPSIILGAAIKGQSSSAFFETIQKGLKFYASGANGFVDVLDVVKAMVYLMDNEVTGERFIISGVNISYKDLFTKIAKYLDVAPPKWKASPFMTSVAWRAASIISLLTGKPALISKDSTESAHKVVQYSSEKYLKLSGIPYIDIDITIRNIAGFYSDQGLLKK